MHRAGWLAGLIGMLAVGCGSEASAPACTPGRSEACACPDGAQGAQVCTEQGTFGACRCEAPSPPPPTPSPMAPAPVAPAAVAPTEAAIEPGDPDPACLAVPALDAAGRASTRFEMEVSDEEASSEEVDSDGDGVAELVVQFPDLCGNAPSCGAWVYRVVPGCGYVFQRFWERPSY